MSFEGYYQLLCKKGHLTIYDAYDLYDEKKTKCDKCGELIVWQELVDTTNNSGNPTKLIKKYTKKCKYCDSVLETRYKIPKTK